MQEVTTQDQRGVLVEAIGATMLELHEIWQVEGKRHSDPDSCHEHRQNLGEFLH